MTDPACPPSAQRAPGDTEALDRVVELPTRTNPGCAPGLDRWGLEDAQLLARAADGTNRTNAGCPPPDRRDPGDTGAPGLVVDLPIRAKAVGAVGPDRPRLRDVERRARVIDLADRVETAERVEPVGAVGLRGGRVGRVFDLVSRVELVGGVSGLARWGVGDGGLLAWLAEVTGRVDPVPGAVTRAAMAIGRTIGAGRPEGAGRTIGAGRPEGAALVGLRAPDGGPGRHFGGFGLRLDVLIDATGARGRLFAAEPGGWVVTAGDLRADTDAAGRFALPGRLTGPVRLVARHDDGAAFHTPWFVA